ncbi:hypothetical protein [Massilia frigida]|nr:hypothetical protein [Massilia frigida]
MGEKPALMRGDVKQLFSGSAAAKPKTTLETISDGIFGGSGLHLPL